MLLAIGLLTTPSHTSGVSLSEFWAWVRYLHAVADTPDLRLTRGFSELDAHQKTILSDDFGMGVPMYWLLDTLQIGAVCDGRYFIERLAASTGAVAAKTAKRGPNKSPDFVARDTAGVWHVIECKGTQSGLNYLNRQLGDAGPPATGAIAQKGTITFPAGHTGQRLACALSIGVEAGRDASLLRIVDPPGEEQLSVGDDELVFATDAVTRAMLARTLRMAGFEATSAVMSAPSGARPTSRPTKGSPERARRSVMEEKERLAREELSDRGERDVFQERGQRYRGRQVELDLPAPLKIDGQEIRSVRIRQGVNAGALQDMARRPFVEEPLQAADSPWRETLGATKLEHDDRSARLHVGDFFVSQIELKA